MMSCKEIARLLSSNDELPFMKKVELHLHLKMCNHCSRYSQHLKLLAGGFRKLMSARTLIDASSVERLEKRIIEEIGKKKVGG